MTPVSAAIVLTFSRRPIEILSAAYLLGSIPFGRLLARERELGFAASLAGVLLDFAEGYLAVWIARRASLGNIHWMTYAALAVILGHMFSVWLGFRGGHGVATAAGAFLPICWQAVALGAGVWIIVVWFWGFAAIGSLAAAAALPMLLYLLYAPGHAPPTVLSAVALLVTTLIVIKHHPNIIRLLAGDEPRFTLRRPES